MRLSAKPFVSVSIAVVLLLTPGCMTSTVYARNPKPTDAAPWANYLLLPITIPADIATLPIQVRAYISAMRGCPPRNFSVTTNTLN